MHRQDGNHHRGFTVPELLAVVAIIAIIISMLMPSLRKAREHAMMVQCQSVIRQTAMANRSYATENRSIYLNNAYRGDKYKGVSYTRFWATDPELLPHLGLNVEQVANRWKTNPGIYGDGFTAGVQWPDTFDCPAQGKPKYWLQNDHWGHEIGIAYNRENNGLEVRTGTVKNASAKFQFADGENWWMNSKSSAYKTNFDLGIIDNGGWGGLLTRHIGERANIAYFDCHIEAVEKKDTFFYGANAGTLNKEIWDVFH